MINLRDIEDAALAAWPAFEERHYDGWLLRFGEGYTKRANSVNPFDESTLDLDQKIAVCEHHYTERRQPTIFRLTPLADPPELDEVLAARGYRVIDPTRVECLDLTSWAASASPKQAKARTLDVGPWLRTYATCSTKRLPPTHRTILDAIAAPRYLAALEVDGRPVTCGMAVSTPPYVGIFSVVTDPARRNRGYGRALMAELLRWGQQEGAAVAYLQVQADNRPARHLYAGLGFRQAYLYWYRVRGSL